MYTRDSRSDVSSPIDAEFQSKVQKAPLTFFLDSSLKSVCIDVCIDLPFISQMTLDPSLASVSQAAIMNGNSSYEVVLLICRCRSDSF